MKITLVKGVSLFETLIVIVLFAALGLLSTRIVLLSLRGTSKSTATLRVRENLDYAISVMERNIRNATSISSCEGNVITYIDGNYNQGTFSCIGEGEDSYVASGSGRLTNSDIEISNCSIICDLGTISNTPSVTIELKGKDASKTGIESASADISTKIYLRQY